MRMPRLSLTTRIFLSSAGIVLLVLAITLVVAQYSAQQAANKSITRGLSTAQARVEDLLKSDRGALAARLGAFASSPDFRARFDDKDFDPFDYTQTAAQESGSRWVQLVSREGVRRAKSDDPTARPDTLTASPLVTSALDGQIAEGFGVTGDSTLIEVVAVPVKGAGDRIIGALMAAAYVRSEERRVGK